MTKLSTGSDTIKSLPPMEQVTGSTLLTTPPPFPWRLSAGLSSNIEDESGMSQRQAKAETSPSPPRPEEELVHRIVIIEDNRADVFLIRAAMQAAGLSTNVAVIADGERALEFIDRADVDGSTPCPTLFVLDLNLPKKNGIEILRHIRQSRTCAAALVMIVTSSDSEQDRSLTTALGANAYFRKPSEYEAYMKLGDAIKTLLNVRKPE